MKTTNHSDEKGRPSLFKPSRASQAETALFATLGVAAMVAIAIALVWGSFGDGAQNARLVAARTSPVVKYVKSGQLVADARTAVAIVQYVLQPEGPAVTNATMPWLTQKNLAMPTNHTAGAPKA